MWGGDAANALPAPARPRRDPRVRPPRDAAAVAGQSTVGADWTPVWMRRPSWLYLPHQQDDQLADVRRTADTDLAGIAAAAPADDAAGHGVQLSPSAGRDAVQDALHFTANALPCGGVDMRGASASSSTPATRTEGDRHACAAASSDAIDEHHVHAGSGGASTAAAAAISGRDRSPGPVSVLQVPPHLAISFAQIEERRMKRQMQRGDDPPAASAAERLAAIRWRIANRRSAAQLPPARPDAPPD
jgi:hypothetical protein